MFDTFSQVWVADFEFESPCSGPPRPVCLVAKELRSGHRMRLFRDNLAGLKEAPLLSGENNIFVAYGAAAEMSCFLELGWTIPENVLDLYAEFRLLLNGTRPRDGFGLLGALEHFGIKHMPTVEKDLMRSLALRGGPWTDEEQEMLLDYCQSDVDTTSELLHRMLPAIDLPRALLRGRYTKAVARMERCGIPLDVATLNDLRDRWPRIQDQLIRDADEEFSIYDGRRFDQERFQAWLQRNHIAWPTYQRAGSSPKTCLKLDKGTFKAVAARYPEVERLRQLRSLLSQLGTLQLDLGVDGRSRASLKAFASKTGRNQPSTAKFLFGLSKWSRQLIRPRTGYSVAYIDWEQQEFGIAAALSHDPAMLAAYESGDPYLAFAKQAGAAPPDANKESHAEIRELYKQCVLAVQYLMGPNAFAFRIASTEDRALELLEMHRRTFRRFWAWSDAAVNYAYLNGGLHTAFGWRLKVTGDTSDRTVRNFPMQGNGAEMMRLACCIATERGISVCCPVHDALLIEAPTDQIADAVAITRAAMAEASDIVLGGFVLRTEEPKPFAAGECFPTKQGRELWQMLLRHLHDGQQPEVPGVLPGGCGLVQDTAPDGNSCQI
jgi:DNA polymerase-1